MDDVYVYVQVYNHMQIHQRTNYMGISGYQSINHLCACVENFLHERTHSRLSIQCAYMRKQSLTTRGAYKVCVYVPIRLTTSMLTRHGSESCDSKEAAVRSRVAGSTAMRETGSQQRGSIGMIDT